MQLLRDRPFYAAFRKLLVEARPEKQVTQSDLAAILKRGQSSVSNYERGERRVDVVEFFEIAEALGFDIEAFVKKLIDIYKNSKK